LSFEYSLDFTSPLWLTMREEQAGMRFLRVHTELNLPAMITV